MSDIALPVLDYVTLGLDTLLTAWWLVPLTLLLGVLVNRIVTDHMAARPTSYVKLLAQADEIHRAEPTRLRIATEHYHYDVFCTSCGDPTKDVVVVRLYDDDARVCVACASTLAPECAA